MRKYILFSAMVIGIMVCLLIVSSGSKKTGEKKIKLEKAGNVFLTKGQMLKVELDANPTTGYEWAVKKGKDHQIIGQIGYLEYVPDKRSAGRVGAGGTSVYRVRALKKGQTTLIFQYKRPWEQNVPPVKRYPLVIEVK